MSPVAAYRSRMITLAPVVLERGGIRLAPLSLAHSSALSTAVADGRLWQLWFVATPTPDVMETYLADALQGQRDGHMLPWAVRDLTTGQVIGSTRYHDVVAHIDRVEIGYTWYAQRAQRTHVNTTCKIELLEHAFDTLGCKVVGLRTDGVNCRSQRASVGLGAKRDGLIRHCGARREGSPRDIVRYSVL